MSKKILIRADSSSKIGLGHIKRDLVYAKKYLSSYDVSFACVRLDGDIVDEIPYKVIELEDDSLDKLLDKLDFFDELIIDHYDISFFDQKKIKSCFPKLLLKVFDDTYERYYCDEIINHNLGAKKSRYSLESFTKVNLIEPLIRDEFYRAKKLNLKKDGVFLSLGGSDSENLTLKILKILKPLNIKINLATTSSNKNLKQLKLYVNKNRFVKLFIDSDVALVMAQSTKGVVTPSVMASEAIFMGLDIVCVRVASNQDEIYKYLKQNRYKCIDKRDIKRLKCLV